MKLDKEKEDDLTKTNSRENDIHQKITERPTNSYVDIKEDSIDFSRDLDVGIASVGLMFILSIYLNVIYF